MNLITESLQGSNFLRTTIYAISYAMLQLALSSHKNEIEETQLTVASLFYFIFSFFSFYIGDSKHISTPLTDPCPNQLIYNLGHSSPAVASLMTGYFKFYYHRSKNIKFIKVKQKITIRRFATIKSITWFQQLANLHW